MRKWVFGGLALLLVVVTIAFIWARVRLKPMLRERLIAAIREYYRREIEVKDIEISALTGFGATIHGLVLHQKDRSGFAADGPGRAVARFRHIARNTHRETSSDW